MTKSKKSSVRTTSTPIENVDVAAASAVIEVEPEEPALAARPEGSAIESDADAYPAIDEKSMVTLLDEAIRSLYGELRGSTQALHRAAQVLALGESRTINIPFCDFPFRFRLPYVDIDRTMAAMLGRYEFPRSANLMSMAIRLPKGGVFVDGGGFIGASASFFSQVCKADEIHVFEPQRIMLPSLEENLAMNKVKGLHLHDAALMDEVGPVDQGTFKPREIANTPYLKHRDGTYTGATIDGLNLDRLDVIHLDYHGSKILALTGALESIKRFRPFISIDNEGRDHKEVSEFLEPMKYQIAALPAGFLFYPKVA